jgi:hypothetical protein
MLGNITNEIVDDFINMTVYDRITEKLAKLLAFFQTPIFAGLSEAEQSRLRNQARFMDGYAAVLEERIAAF